MELKLKAGFVEADGVTLGKNFGWKTMGEGTSTFVSLITSIYLK